MKRKSISIKACMAIAMLFISVSGCKKETRLNIPPVDLQAKTAELKQSLVFKQFITDYLSVFNEMVQYQRTKLGDRAAAFKSEMSNSSLSEEEVQSIYLKNGVDFSKMIDYKNALDNIMLGLLIKDPELANIPAADFKQFFVQAMGETIKSNVILLNNHNNLQKSMKMLADTAPDESKLTADEIWDCILEAVGLNIGSQLSLPILAKKGIAIITKTVTKALAKFAGPIGTAIMIADLGFCIYGEIND